ncbi:hypothetical protein E2C01_082163 [Portunus trituberculatus]|uniref:Uncharacterized protein n=1 Tax=Portunus trituberculatus TaxID=210409 RepID=A0A5B7IXQ8_PORTR|nr:hypothetical protein [Portunus trituberculatus]
MLLTDRSVLIGYRACNVITVTSRVKAANHEAAFAFPLAEKVTILRALLSHLVFLFSANVKERERTYAKERKKIGQYQGQEKDFIKLHGTTISINILPAVSPMTL